MSVVAGGEVGDLTAREQIRTEVAQVLLASRAEGATATRRDESQHHVIARRERRDSRADLDDLTRALMAPDDRELLDADFWTATQRGILAGHVEDVFPYPETLRFRRRFGLGAKPQQGE